MTPSSCPPSSCIVIHQNIRTRATRRIHHHFLLCLVLSLSLLAAETHAFSTTRAARSSFRSLSSTSLPLFYKSGRPWTTPNSRFSTPSSTTYLLTAASSATSMSEKNTVVFSDTKKDDDNNPYGIANQIAPRTKPLPESLSFYAQYLLRYFLPDRYDDELLKQKKKHQYRKDSRRRKRDMLLRDLDEDDDTSATTTSSSSSFWQQFNEQRRNVMNLAGYTRRMIVPSFTFLFLGALVSSIVPNYWGKCIQCVATLSGSRAQLVEALVGLGVTSTLAALFTGIRGSLFWIGGCRANYNVRVKLHRSLLLQEAAFFDTNETGYLLSRLNSDVNKIGQVISYHVNVVLRQSAQFLFGSIYLVKISPKLSMYAFAGIFLVAWLSAVYGGVARKLAEKVQDTFADATAVAETSFSMSETIRAFNGAEIESAKFESAQSRALELEEVQAWAYGTHKFLSDTLQSMLQVGLLVACWVAGKAGELPAGDLTTFLVYTGFVLESSNEVGDQWAKIQQAIGASSSVFDLIKRMPSIRDPPIAPKQPARAVIPSEEAINIVPNPMNVASVGPALTNGATNGAANGMMEKNGATEGAAISQEPVIAIKNVTVEYDAMERPALSGINVNVYPGDRVALVGRSGSGKSSMLRTMLRFYDPSVGHIDLDGQDLRSLTRAETAARVSLVEQEPHVFPMSLMDNVLYGIDKDDMDAETGDATYSTHYRTRVSDCLSLAGLSVVPGNELGLELDTRIGEGGRSLSGGQRQRVAIARAIIRSPQVLLLDEPTAALDSESERMVVDSLKKAMQQTKSMVMVTHRLGVVRSLNVNRVIVLDRGEIVEEGHPEELLQDKDSQYFALAREQGITCADDPSGRLPAFS